MAPVVGIILLFGMVFIGAALVAGAGMMLMDSVESESEAEQALSCLDRTDHNVQTLLRANTQEEIPCESGVRDHGSVTLTLSNDDGEDETVTIDPLGSFEYELDDRRLGYQSGGVFQLSDGTTRIHTPPDVGFGEGPETPLAEQTMSLNFLSFTSVEQHGSVTAMNHNQSATTAKSDEIERALAGGYEHLEIEIESDYHDAWATHLESAFYADTYDNVSVDHDESAETVTLSIEHFAEPDAFFQVTDVEPADWMVVYRGNQTFELDAEVTNTGHVTGSDDLTLEIPAADADDREFEIDELEPGESVTKTFDVESFDIPTEGPGNQPNDINRYGAYDYTVSTSDSDASGSFYLTFPDNAFYRIDDLSMTDEGPITTAGLNVTNIGELTAPVETTMTLQSNDDSLPDPIAEWDETVELDPWDETTIEYDFNRSVLPDANYTYTIEIDNDGLGTSMCNLHESACVREGSFEIEDGAIGGPGEVIITEPSNVSVSIIGTEISAEGYDQDQGSWVKYWSPVTASAVVGDTRYRFLPDGSIEEIAYEDPHETEIGEQMEDFNLNTFGTQEHIYSLEEEIEEGSVTIEATYWECYSSWLRTGWEYAGTDEWQEREYNHFNCEEFGEPITVDVASGEIDADAGFVMTRDADRNELPDIEEGYDRQRNIQEVFEDGTDDIELIDGELTLGQNDFAFMMEVTMDHEGLVSTYGEDYDGEYNLDTDNQTESNLAAWDIAENYRNDELYGTGDPNFNDVIGFVQVDGGGQYIDLDPDAILDDYRLEGVSGAPSIEYSDDEYDTGGPTVEAGTGVIEIS
ncbi:DUF7289 family protein [Halovivax gelatinilyticus]|uniref:DUF7289 family protein n=1 Tax=Halovivax gelatinilyticus TaxID=2961597 RepID=UPI0020CA90E2|nr:hypothetical protein [Halovivax gelatinilyticus]